MKTNCMVVEKDVIEPDPNQTVESLEGVECIHMYVLCPKHALPKEYPAPHRRLAKRDTRLCEAHSKQERRARQKHIEHLELTGQSTLAIALKSGAAITTILSSPTTATPTQPKKRFEQVQAGSTQPAVSPRTTPIDLISPTQEQAQAQAEPKKTCVIPGCSDERTGSQSYFERDFDPYIKSSRCHSCDVEFSAMKLNIAVMEALILCSNQDCHEKHFKLGTTPFTGPLQFGRLAGVNAKKESIWFCSCVKRVVTTWESSDEAEQYTKFLRTGAAPSWTTGEEPFVVLSGTTSAHVGFRKHPRRRNIRIEVVLLEHEQKISSNTFERESVGFQCIQIKSENYATKSSFMLEGLKPGHRYAIRLLETITDVETLGNRMQQLATVASRPTIFETLPQNSTKSTEKSMSEGEKGFGWAKNEATTKSIATQTILKTESKGINTLRPCFETTPYRPHAKTTLAQSAQGSPTPTSPTPTPPPPPPTTTTTTMTSPTPPSANEQRKDRDGDNIASVLINPTPVQRILLDEDDQEQTQRPHSSESQDDSELKDCNQEHQPQEHHLDEHQQHQHQPHQPHGKQNNNEDSEQERGGARRCKENDQDCEQDPEHEHGKPKKHEDEHEDEEDRGQVDEAEVKQHQQQQKEQERDNQEQADELQRQHHLYEDQEQEENPQVDDQENQEDEEDESLGEEDENENEEEDDENEEEEEEEEEENKENQKDELVKVDGHDDDKVDQHEEEQGNDDDEVDEDEEEEHEEHMEHECQVNKMNTSM